jgi:hypothetical protein
MYYQNIGELVDKCITIAGGLFCFYLSFRPEKVWKNSLPEARQRNKLILQICGPGMVFFAIISLCLFDWSSFHKEYVIRQIDKQITAIKQGADKIPAGDERTTQLISNLKAIDTSSAPPEVSEAMRNYIQSIEQIQEALKAHQDTTLLTQAFTQKAKTLIDAMAKYQ